MKIYNFSVVITQDKDGVFLAQVPTLPGCHTQAKNLAELFKRIQEAIELCLEVENEKKHKIQQEKFIGVQQIEVAA
ncbi:type II toxin-antitoxin system HicB family antitoxin [Candidatus Peregrinibacteria bacterium]|nr:type II toxin-antitoxin system HicB family antitoxin [Candidatus Peregrinibacteria bacterium]